MPIQVPSVEDVEASANGVRADMDRILSSHAVELSLLLVELRVLLDTIDARLPPVAPPAPPAEPPAPPPVEPPPAPPPIELPPPPPVEPPAPPVEPPAPPVEPPAPPPPPPAPPAPAPVPAPAPAPVPAPAPLSTVGERVWGWLTSQKDVDLPSVQQSIAKAGGITVGLYYGWRGTDLAAERKAVQQLKAINPKLVVAQYTLAMEARDVVDTAWGERIAELNRRNAWLYNKAGAKVQWTTEYSAWNVNMLAPADATGETWGQWFAKWAANRFFTPVPEFDIWMFDNVFAQPRGPAANWLLDGVDRDGTKDQRVIDGWRAAHKQMFDAARARSPRTTLMGNCPHDLSTMPGMLDHIWHEGLLGEGWSIGGLRGEKNWTGALDRYLDSFANLRPGKNVVIFGAAGAATDVTAARFALCSALLGDGWFQYTDSAAKYKTVPWFADFNLPLGKAIDPPARNPWQSGVYRRRYEGQTVLVNPTGSSVTVTLDGKSVTLGARTGALVAN